MNDRVAQAALDRAAEEKNLLLVYQPIHDARSGRIVSAEALLRQRRESGEIREASIIAEAAEAGPALFALDSWSFQTAYTDAARWQSQLAPHVRINVNLSPREFQEGNVLPRLTKLVAGCGIDTRRVNLEITETSYIEHPERTMRVLEEIKELGVQLWLDDFGTGHSSVTHLLHFPLEGIKLPGQFVKDIHQEGRSRKITRSLIALAHELELKVTAEGVEHQEQLQSLLEFGCDYVQGFLFSRPMTVDRFEALLESQ